jgi:hypothetical protein
MPGTGFALLMTGGALIKTAVHACVAGGFVFNDYYKEAFKVSPIRELGNVRTGEQTLEQAKDKIWNPQNHRGDNQIIKFKDNNIKIDILAEYEAKNKK